MRRMIFEDDFRRMSFLFTECIPFLAVQREGDRDYAGAAGCRGG